jgi:Na+-translocating ferredoxin:NAD+ oxidoreductase RnfG subunit
LTPWFSRGEFLRAAALAFVPVPRGQSVLTQEEALALAFPGAHAIERRTAYLSTTELARARAAAGEGVDVETRVVTYYLALRSERPVGVAYFDVHRVRTLPEVLMVVVGTDDRIRRLEVLRFQEPPDYRPPAAWLQRFRGRALDRQLSLKGGVANLTGATLTAGAVTDAARRMLALHRVVRPF